MFKLGLLLIVLLNGFIDCKHFDHVKGGVHLKGPSFWSSYKAKVVELPSPTIEHIAPIQQRLVLEEKVHHTPVAVHHPVQEKLVVEEKIHHIEQPRVIEQVRVEEGVKGHLVTATKSHHQNIVITDHHHDELAHERRHEELHHQREQREQLKEIQHFQQIQQHQQIRQQLEQQKHLEEVAVQQKTAEHVDQIQVGQVVEGKTNVHHIEQIIQQKQERNEKLTEAEEAIAEPFPLIPKTHFTCDDKPVLPGMYADLETGCRVYHFCFANTEKAEIVQQVHQDKVDLLHNDVHHTNSLLISALPKPEQQQMKSFFCGEGTLFNQKLLICDHAVNVICPESIHYYSANLEFGKAAPEPAAQLVQQREISKTNHIVQVREPIVQVREQIVQQPIVQVREQIVQQPIVQVREHIVQQPVVQVKEQIVQHAEPVKIVQHHDAIKIVEPPKHIVQVKEQIVEQPVVQVREQIVQHHEPARIVQEQVKVGHLVESPVIVQQRQELATKNLHQDRVVTHTDLGSFASASDRNSDWRENRSWSTSRTVWGNLNGENNDERNSSSTVSTAANSERSNENSERKIDELITNLNNNTSNEDKEQTASRAQARPINRRFLGEQLTSNIPETKFTCEGKPFENGMYADVETGCRIYHQCLNGRKSTFLCSRGTVFNQAKLSCDFEERVKCNESQQFYMTNVEFN